jgi:hypothetical protein
MKSRIWIVPVSPISDENDTINRSFVCFSSGRENASLCSSLILAEYCVLSSSEVHQMRIETKYEKKENNVEENLPLSTEFSVSRDV